MLEGDTLCTSEDSIQFIGWQGSRHPGRLLDGSAAPSCHSGSRDRLTFTCVSGAQIGEAGDWIKADSLNTPTLTCVSGSRWERRCVCPVSFRQGRHRGIETSACYHHVSLTLADWCALAINGVHGVRWLSARREFPRPVPFRALFFGFLSRQMGHHFLFLCFFLSIVLKVLRNVGGMRGTPRRPPEGEWEGTWL